MTIIASEPLTEVRSDWVSVPENHVLVVRSSGEVLCAPFYLRYEPCFRARFAVSELTRVFSFLESLNVTKALHRTGLSSPSASSGRPGLLSTTRSSSYAPSGRRLLQRTHSGSETEKTTPPRPAPFRRCSSSRLSIELPPAKKTPPHSDLVGLADTSGFDGYEELRNPHHVLSASGQVHVSAMVRFNNHLFSADGGAAGGRVCAYNLETFELVAWSSNWGILALCCDVSTARLLGSRSDGQTLVWDISNPSLKGELVMLGKMGLPRIGHVLSMTVVESKSLLVGSQDGYLRRIRLPTELLSASTSTNLRAIDCPAYQDDDTERMKDCGTTCKFQDHDRVPTMDTARSHCGYITAVQVLDGFAFSASSCSLIKKWDLETNTCVETLGGHQSSVMDLCACSDAGFLFSAALDGTIRTWDVSSKEISHYVRSFHTPFEDPLSCVAIIQHESRISRLCGGSTAGAVWIWEFNSRSILQRPDTPCMMLNVSASSINSLAVLSPTSLAVGAGSGRISVWQIPEAELIHSRELADGVEEEEDFEVVSGTRTDNNAMLEALAQFVAIPSVSSNPDMRESCLESANFMLTTFQKFACETRFCLSRKSGIPCILGRMPAVKPNPNGKFVFVYGHHDVVSCSADEWKSHPWCLEGREGYLYGRGVSDDKGPCLAMLFAAAEVRARGELGVDVVFCVEGEQETTLSIQERKLDQVLEDHHEFVFGASTNPPLCVVVSNNTWVSETHPCVTYGMRGVLDIELVVQSKHDNMHSGIHGGALYEPLGDLVTLLHSCERLKDDLAKHVAPLSEGELGRLRTVAKAIDADQQREGNAEHHDRHGSHLDTLIARWAHTSLSVSGVKTSNVDNAFRKVPYHASARVSIHFVPNLTVSSCKELVLNHFTHEFEKQRTSNTFALNVVSSSDPWIGNVESQAFTTVAQALEKVWGEPPLFVREGGSYSGITSFLERTLAAPALHLPMAQAHDHAHLHDERIKVDNLFRGRQVFEELLRTFSSS